jgi:D-3-phosphoglycerate dehydrogenase
MLRMMPEFAGAFAGADVGVHAPEVVQTLGEDELITLVPEFDGWIIGDDPATRQVLSAGRAGRLKAAVKWGVGVDNVDFTAARELGLPIVNTPGVFGREVGDIAIGYVIGLARETFFIDREIRQKHGWPKPSGISLAGKTVALVGFGDIGRQTARRMVASEMNVIVYDPAYKPDSSLPVTVAAWPERLDEADFLVFTCPLNAQTRGMFSTRLLPTLKRGVRVVNVGRGPVIEEHALAEAIRMGIVHSAALDVFEIEPLAPDSPLRNFPRCIFGSHNASNTVDAVRSVSRLAIGLLFERLGMPVPTWDNSR